MGKELDDIEKTEEQPEFTDLAPEKPKAKSKISPVRDIITGNVLVRGYLLKQVPYIILLVVLSFTYIANRYKNEKMAMQEQSLKEELKNLRSESITTAAELMRISRQSEVVKLVKERGLGLEESTTPPKIIEDK